MTENINASLDIDIDALQLEEIVSEIFKYLPSKQLLSLRLVCKQWDGLIKSKIRKRRDLCIRLETRTYLSPGGVPRNEDGCNNEFIEFLRAGNQCIPSVLYMVLSLEVHAFTNDCFDLIYAFCEILGPMGVVRELVINCERLDTRDETPIAERFTRILASFSETLHTLDIVAWDDYWRPDPDQEQEAEEGLANNALELQLSSLEVLKLPERFERGGRSISTFPLRCILNAVQGCNLKTVESLDFMHCQEIVCILCERAFMGGIRSLRLDYLDENMVDKLLSCGDLSLEELHLYGMARPRDFPHGVGRTALSMDKLIELLQRVKPKLTNLSLEPPPPPFCTLDQLLLPTFASLKKLSLKIPGSRLYDALVSLNFKLVTPVLETLELINRNTGGFNAACSDAVPAFRCLTLKELILDLSSKSLREGHGNRNRNVNLFIWFWTMFPNVEKLVLKKATNKFLQQLWTTHNQWKLQELDLTFHENSGKRSRDLMLFGLSADRVVQCANRERIDFSGSMEDWVRNVPYVMEKLEESLSTPTLRNLKSLRRLRVVEDIAAGRPPKSVVSYYALSNLSAFFGFGEMKELRTLEIGYNTMEDPAKSYLRDNLIEFIYPHVPKIWDFKRWLMIRTERESSRQWPQTSTSTSTSTSQPETDSEQEYESDDYEQYESEEDEDEDFDHDQIWVFD